MTTSTGRDGPSPRKLKAMLQQAARGDGGDGGNATRTVDPPFVFVAYARADQEIVGHLVDELRTTGLVVRWDQDIRVGESFRDRIGDYLARSDAVVVVWSRASVRSRFTIDEATAAERLGKLVSVRMPGLADHDIPLGFQQYRCESIFDRTLILRAIAALTRTPTEA